MISFMHIFASAVMLLMIWRLRQLKKENTTLRRQRATAFKHLAAAENYSNLLEQEQFEIRRIVGAKTGERTSAVVRRCMGERRMWS